MLLSNATSWLPENFSLEALDALGKENIRSDPHSCTHDGEQLHWAEFSRINTGSCMVGDLPRGFALR